MDITQNQSSLTKKQAHLGLKIFLALLPALVFMQNFAWMTLNEHVGFGFITLWLLVIWSAWQFTEKNHVLERLFRLTEISFFLLPVSAIILSLRFASKVSEVAHGNDFAAAGASIGAALGGTFAVGIAFVIGVIGGIVFHLVAGKYEKRAEASGIQHAITAANKHGIILTIVALYLLAILASALPSSPAPSSSPASTNPPSTSATTSEAESANVNQPASQPQVVNQKPSCPGMTKIGNLLFTKANDTDGNPHVWLNAEFLKPAEFSDGWELENLPSTNMFSSDDFVCGRGSVAGQSINKLYCTPTFSYRPEIKKNTVDAAGNITDTKTLYIKSFVFDVSVVGTDDLIALGKLPIESMSCDSSYF